MGGTFGLKIYKGHGLQDTTKFPLLFTQSKRCLHPHRPGRDPPQGCKAADQNNPGGTTRRSLADDEFDCIDDFGEDEFLGNDYKNI